MSRVHFVGNTIARCLELSSSCVVAYWGGSGCPVLSASQGFLLAVVRAYELQAERLPQGANAEYGREQSAGKRA